MKQINTDMIHDLLEKPNLSEEAKEFFEYFLKHPEEMKKINKLLINGKSILAVSNIIADFIEEVSEAEAESILQSIYKARTEDEFKTVSRLSNKRWSYIRQSVRGRGSYSTLSSCNVVFIRIL